MTTDDICSINDCRNKSSKLGLCPYHYRILWGQYEPSAAVENAHRLYPSSEGLTPKQWIRGWNDRLSKLALMANNKNLPINMNTKGDGETKARKKILDNKRIWRNRKKKEKEL